MKVKLLTTMLNIADMEGNAALAALTCRGNAHCMNIVGYKASDTLKNIIKAGHESILEHINLTFGIQGLSRACLHELERHRHISLSVESTRHTLRKQLLEEEIDHYPVLSIVGTIPGTDEKFDVFNLVCLALAKIAKDQPAIPNDELKYFIPEFWPTNLIITLNVREFRYILKLRTAPEALKEFRDLARSMFHEVPEQLKYLLQDCVHEEIKA